MPSFKKSLIVEQFQGNYLNPVKNALASRQFAFLATSIAFCDILTRACAEIKILRLRFLEEKATYVFRLFDFWNFFWPFLFLLFFLFCCSDWPSTGLACV